EGLTDTVDLAALERLDRRRGAAVALDDLEFHAEHVFEHLGNRARRRAGAAAADQQLLGEQVLGRFDLAGAERDTDAARQTDTADPAELARIELDIVAPKYRLARQVA